MQQGGEVFFETSALIEFTFWDKETRNRIVAALPLECTKVTSRYVIYELCRGFLSNLRLLHNKTFQVRSFDELFEYAAHCQRRSHKLGTILGAFRDFHKQPSAYEACNSRQQLLAFRGFLRGKIRRGFNCIEGRIDEIINDVGCRDDFGSPYEDSDGYLQWELKTSECGKESNCGLRAYYRGHRSDFEKVRSTLDKAFDPETRRRWEALPKLYRVKGRNFDRGVCYSASDATITHESSAAVVVTKNVKHIQPIAEVLGKRVVSY